MIVDANEMLAFAAKTSSIAPQPTIIPGPSYRVEEATETGKRTLWAVFIIQLVAVVIFSAVAYSIPISKRLYHVITTLIVAFAAISYFAMANGEGVSWNVIETVIKHKNSGVETHEIIHRQVYWARYVDWSITTPLLLLDLSLLAGLSGGHIAIAVVADLVMVLTGLFAAFGDEQTSSKWGWYTIACIAYLVIVWQLAINGRATAFGKGGKVGSFFASIAGFTLLVWTAYPIVWGIADGSRTATVDQEIIAYAVLDILAKPIFGAWLLFTHQSIPETNIEIGGFWSEGLGNQGAIRVGDDDEGA